MNDSLVQLLRCPITGSRLRLHTVEKSTPTGNRDASVELGLLQSLANPEAVYPIVNGVPRMLPDAFSSCPAELFEACTLLPPEIQALLNRPRVDERSLPPSFDHIRKSFSSEWAGLSAKDHAWGRGPATRRHEFFRRLGVSEGSLRDMLVLDAGCGHGEIEFALADDEVDIIAVDISDAVDDVRRRIDDSAASMKARIEVIQANICELPIADESCDIIFADGVLHHTPDTSVALRCVTAKLRDGGKCFVMVYSYDHKNRLDRARMWINDRLRALTLRLPYSALAVFCYALAPIHWMFVNGYNWATGTRKYRRRTLRETKLSLFDGLSPKYDWTHSTAELMEMFTNLGYTDLKKTFYDHNGIGVVGTLRRRASD